MEEGSLYQMVKILHIISINLKMILKLQTRDLSHAKYLFHHYISNFLANSSQCPHTIVG